MALHDIVPYRVVDGNFADCAVTHSAVLFQEVEKLLHKLSWDFAKKLAPYDPIEWADIESELFSISCVGFMNVCRKWEDTKKRVGESHINSVAFSTYLYESVTQLFLNHIERDYTPSLPMTDIDFYTSEDRKVLEGIRGFKRSLRKALKEFKTTKGVSPDGVTVEVILSLRVTIYQMECAFYGVQRQPVSVVYEEHLCNIGAGSPITLSPHEKAEFNSMIRSLGQDAREIVDVVLGYPVELEGYSMPSIIEYFKKYRGWRRVRVIAAVTQICKTLREYILT